MDATLRSASTAPCAAYRLRKLNLQAAPEIEWVARGMHLTLVEVEGPAGGELYSMEWARARLKSLLDPSQHTSQVFLAVSEEDSDSIVGHTILRIDTQTLPDPYGLFSTTYIDPPMRRLGLADRLLGCGEEWIRSHGLPEAATWTSSTNIKLIRLYEKHGYVQTTSGMNGTTLMVRLGKSMQSRAPY